MRLIGSWVARASLSVCILFFLPTVPATAEQPLEINTILMRSTFKISGNGVTGTAFILGKPAPSQPTRAYTVMVTAAHVLNQMTGEQATLFLRIKEGDAYKKLPFPIKIREGM